MLPQLERYFTSIGVDLNGVSANLHGWDVSIAKRDDEDVAIVIVKGPEIHFVSLSEHKAMTRKNTLEYLSPIMEKFGYVTTRVPIAEEEHRLRRLLGFEFSWQDDEYTYWCLTQLPFQRKKS